MTPHPEVSVKCPKIKAKCSGKRWQPPKNNVGDLSAGRCQNVMMLDIKGWCRPYNLENDHGI